MYIYIYVYITIYIYIIYILCIYICDLGILRNSPKTRPSQKNFAQPRRESMDLRRRHCALPPRSWRRSRPPAPGCARSRGPPDLGVAGDDAGFKRRNQDLYLIESV